MKKLRQIFSSGATRGVLAATMLGSVSIMPGCQLATELAPCITEAEVTFEYIFTSNDPENDNPEDAHISELVDNIQLFIFDNNNDNILYKIESVRKSDILAGRLPIILLSGDYTMVAWGLGNGALNLADGGYADVQMVDPSSNYYTPVEIGKTKLEEFRTRVVQPENQDFSDLYFAIVENFHVPIPVDGNVLVSAKFEFIPYSNNIKLTINGMDAVRKKIAAQRAKFNAARVSRASGDTRADEEIELPLDIFLTGKNGIFAYDGSIDERAVELTYTDKPAAYSDDQAVVDIRTLRIDVDRHSVDPMMLHIHPVGAVTEAEKHSIVPDIDLLSLIQKVKDSNGNYILDEQAEIDKASVIPIEFTITPHNEEVVDPEDEDYSLNISISVDGWKVMDIDSVEIIVETR